MYTQQRKDFLSTIDIAIFNIEKYANIYDYVTDEEYLYYLEK